MPPKVAIVTGSNSGVGLAIVRALCKHYGENGVVYLTARNQERGMQAVEVLKKEGLNPRFHLLDVNNVTSMEKLRDDIKAEHGGLDILVNNAGIAHKNSEMVERRVRMMKVEGTYIFKDKVPLHFHCLNLMFSTAAKTRDKLLEEFSIMLPGN